MDFSNKKIIFGLLCLVSILLSACGGGGGGGTPAPVATYSVSVPPTNQPCTRTYGAGTINAANVANVNVFCGLAGGLNTFTPTASMTAARFSHTSTLLPSGKVLVSGGFNGTSVLASAELYNPSTGVWTTATSSLATGRDYHTSTLLPNGKVLVSGGYNGTGVLTSAELYDPSTGVWTVTSSLATGRDYHTATLLPNGKVLVSGGQGGAAGVLASAERYF